MDQEKFNQLCDDVVAMKDSLLGTYQKKGIISKVEDHDIWIAEQKKTSHNLLNSTYKFIIMLVLAYIAAKVGLK